MESDSKPTLFFTLFETQLVRSYLESDKGAFFKSLSSKYNLVVVTSTSLFNHIATSMRILDVNASITSAALRSFKEPLIAKIVGFYLRWNDKSPTTRRKLRTEFTSNEKMRAKYSMRLILHYLLPTLPVVSKYLRRIYARTIVITDLLPEIRNLNDYGVSTVFISSLTNYWEDVPCGVYLKSLGCKTVGSVRSWDNLVSHGQLKFLPDHFLSHSRFMSDTAVKLQQISRSQIIQWITPTYRAQFLLNRDLEECAEKHVVYACMGLSINPDDLNFVRRLIELNQIFSPKINITLLEHPKFKSSLDGVNLPTNFRRETFPYDCSSLMDYYKFLKSADLLICGGTTAALDGCFLGINVAIVGYEVSKQNYWMSGIRYLDMALHTSLFFKKAELQIISDENELITILQNPEQVRNYRLGAVSEFTGDPDTDFLGIFMNSLENIH